MSEFGAELGRMLRTSGLSLRALARASHYDAGYLSKVINGYKNGSRELALDVDRRLDAGGALVAAWRRSAGRPPVPVLPLASPAPDPDLRDRIARAVANPAWADKRVTSWLERTLAEHRRVNDTVGAVPLLDPVGGQLAVVSDLARNARPAIARGLISLAAQYAQFLAWLRIETKEHDAAVTWYDRARAWAEEAGDPNMAATTLSMKAHLAWSLDDPWRCIRMAQAARWYDSRLLTPGMKGMAAQMEARGNALAGDADNARRLLDEAQNLITAASAKPEAEPPWMYFYDENWFGLQRGMAELHLQNWPAAISLLAAGLATLPGSYRRDRAWYGACLARAYAGAGEPGQAEETALAFAPDIRAVNSYARGDLLATARTLGRSGATSAAQAIRHAIDSKRPLSR